MADPQFPDPTMHIFSRVCCCCCVPGKTTLVLLLVEADVGSEAFVVEGDCVAIHMVMGKTVTTRNKCVMKGRRMTGILIQLID